MRLREYLNQERGRAAKLAKALSIPASLLSAWDAEDPAKRRPVPAERCPDIEKETGGLVKCEELLPSVDWAYLRGTAPIDKILDTTRAQYGLQPAVEVAE